MRRTPINDGFLLKDTFSVVSMRGMNVLLLGIVSVLLTHSMSPREYGAYSFFTNLALWASVFITFGLDIVASREIAKFMARNSYGSIFYFLLDSLILMISISIGIATIGTLAQLVIPRFQFPIVPGIYVYMLAFGLSLANFESGVFLGLDRIFISQFSRFVLPWVLFAISLIIARLLKAKLHLPVILTLQSAIFIGIGILLLVYIVFILPGNQHYSRDQVHSKRLLSLAYSGFPFVILSILYISTQFTPTLFLQIFGKYEHIAFLDIAIKLSLIPTFFLSAVNTTITPKIVKLYQENMHTELQRLVSKSAFISFVGSLTVSTIMLAYGNVILSAIWGEAYSRSFYPLVILTVGEVVNAFSGPVALLLNMSGHEKIVLRVMIIVLVFSLGMSAVFIPLLGLEGAAIARAGSTIVWNLVLIYYVQGILRINPVALSKILIW